MRAAALKLALVAVLAGASPLPVGAAGPAGLGQLLEALRLGRPTARLAAPVFDLPTLDGRPVRLGDLRGRVVLLYFWATW